MHECNWYMRLDRAMCTKALGSCWHMRMLTIHAITGPPALWPSVSLLTGYSVKTRSPRCSCQCISRRTKLFWRAPLATRRTLSSRPPPAKPSAEPSPPGKRLSSTAFPASLGLMWWEGKGVKGAWDWFRSVVMRSYSLSVVLNVWRCGAPSSDAFVPTGIQVNAFRATPQGALGDGLIDDNNEIFILLHVGVHVPGH